MILWFEEMDKNSIKDAGGKGANLGEMTQHGFPVPPGYCITTVAYREHVNKLELAPYMALLYTAVLKEDIHKLNEISAKVRKLIEQTCMSKQTEQAVCKAYRKLTIPGIPLVSVRSSATAEDLPTASFAGQQETFLSINGEAQLLEHVKKCWASLWTPRSITYRQKNGFAHEQVALAVIVQVMVESEKSGVLFTINPVTGKTGEMMINASYGLGESVVSGRVTPDTFCIAKQGKPFIIDKNLGTKEIQNITGVEGLTFETHVSKEMQSKFCLEEEDLLKLRDLGLHVERHYGKPQDIEWAIVGKKLYLLQTRPITATSASDSSNRLEKNNEKIRKQSTMKRKILDNLKEHIPDAPYPLDYEPLLMVDEQKNAVFRELGITMPAARKMVLMNEQGILSVGRILPYPNIRLLWIPIALKRLLRLNSSSFVKETKDSLMSELVALERIDLPRLDDKALSAYIQQAVDLAMKWVYLRFRAYVFPMVFSGFFLNRMIGKIKQLGHFVNQYDFLAGLNYKTAEIERALYHMADQLDKAHAVKRIFLKEPSKEILSILERDPDKCGFYLELTEFLKNYGARTMKAYTPFSTESWSERPELLIDILKSILKAGNIRQHMEQQREGENKFMNLKNTVTGHLAQTKRKRFEHLLEQFRSSHMGREELVYRMEQCFVAARSGVAMAANRLYENKLLSEPEEIRYFTLSELKQVLTGISNNKKLFKMVAIRKANRTMAEHAWHAPSPEENGAADHRTTIQGLSGSPGTANGMVRIINTPDEFGKLQKGEVLVSRFTDPVWTPLFSIACAVVCDTGGPLSHAAIVAREYGMPAVLGTGNATSVLKDGDMVTVDGSKGIVAIGKRSK